MTDEVRTIFEDTVLGSLATINEDGTPWATPLHVVADDTAIYWFSHTGATHSQNITRDGRVSFVVFSPDESSGPKGVYVQGNVEVLNDQQRANVYELFTQRLESVPPSFEKASAYRLPFGTLDTNKSRGNCWYFYS